MIIVFFFYCWATRQLGVVALIFALQAFIYAELVHVAIREAQEAQTPGFSALYYYWFGVAAFFMYARVLWPYMQDSSSSSSGSSGSGASSSLGDSSSAAHSGLWGGSTSLPSLALYALCWLVEKHVPVAFALYCVGVVLFVISLRRRRNFKYQFAQLAYCHIALLAVVGQSTLLAANAFHGLVWVLLPTGLIIVNDSFAYLAGEWGNKGRTVCCNPHTLSLSHTHTQFPSPPHPPSRHHLWAHASHSPVPKKDRGGLHWRRPGHACLCPALCGPVHRAAAA